MYPIKSSQLLLLLHLWLVLTGCGSPDYRQIQGETMGTYYAVSVAADAACDVSAQQLEDELVRLNAALSTYMGDSELSTFNGLPPDEWHTMSATLAAVLDAARELWQRSDGAFDVTVGPLVNLWGFGPDATSDPPAGDAQEAARATVGMQLLHFRQHDGAAQVAKSKAGVYVDLSALAKGYAVDVLAEIYQTAGCENFMVDIGGEIRASGVSPRGGPWRIGIEVPDPQAVGVAQAVLALDEMSIATSGDYRNFRMVDGVRVDHLIDPRSGRPADNRVVSATVLHPSAMWADAYATTLMVMGMQEGLAFAEREGVAVYLMSRQPLDSSQGMQNDQTDSQSGTQTRLESSYNSAMANYLQ